MAKSGKLRSEKNKLYYESCLVDINVYEREIAQVYCLHSWVSFWIKFRLLGRFWSWELIGINCLFTLSAQMMMMNEYNKGQHTHHMDERDNDLEKGLKQNHKFG